jgi:hypothetical protein
MVHYKLRNLEKTEAYWRKAIDLNPNFFGYYQNLVIYILTKKSFTKRQHTTNKL